MRGLTVWPKRVVLAFLWFLGIMPAALRVEYLRWLLEDMGPQHPCVGEVLIEIANLEAGYA